MCHPLRACSPGETVHIVFPLLRSAQAWVITLPGEEPPKLGMPLEETGGQHAARVKGPVNPALDLSCTYTFSYCRCSQRVLHDCANA